MYISEIVETIDNIRRKLPAGEKLLETNQDSLMYFSRRLIYFLQLFFCLFLLAPLVLASR